MKKFIKVLAVALVMFSTTLTTTAQAAVKESTIVPKNFGEPIEVNTYEEEDGSIVTEKIYFLPDAGSSGIMPLSKSGKGWYKNEKIHKWGNGTKMKYYAQGYFTWGNGKASVKNASGGVSNVPSKIKVSNKKTTTSTGQYAWVFNHYAQVNFSFTTTNQIGLQNDFSVTIRVSESGNMI